MKRVTVTAVSPCKVIGCPDHASKSIIFGVVVDLCPRHGRLLIAALRVPVAARQHWKMTGLARGVDHLIQDHITRLGAEERDGRIAARDPSKVKKEESAAVPEVPDPSHVPANGVEAVQYGRGFPKCADCGVRDRVALMERVPKGPKGEVFPGVRHVDRERCARLGKR